MEDSKIIALYWDRDESAIPVTAQKYGDYCASIARGILNSALDAEECVNDTWLGAWNTMPPHRPEKLAAFLGKITRNLAFHRYRGRRASRRGGGELELVLEELEDVVSGKDLVEEQVDLREMVAAINAFVARLPADKRNLFVCRYWYAVSVKEIARRYHLRPATVSMTLSRLRDRLKQELMEGGFDL